MERLHSLITDIKTRMGEERSRLQGELHQEERRHDSTAVKLAAVYRQLRMQLFSLGVYPGGGLYSAFPDSVFSYLRCAVSMMPSALTSYYQPQAREWIPLEHLTHWRPRSTRGGRTLHSRLPRGQGARPSWARSRAFTSGSRNAGRSGCGRCAPFHITVFVSGKIHAREIFRELSHKNRLCSERGRSAWCSGCTDATSCGCSRGASTAST